MYIPFKDLVTKTKIPKSTIYNWLKYYQGLTGVSFINNKRYYTEDTINVLLTIKYLRNTGTKKEQIKKYLKENRCNKMLTNKRKRKTKKNTNVISSPLRFPGSKSKVIERLEPYFHTPHCEYREPFIGGGSIFFGKEKIKRNWINDKDPNVYAFFIAMRDYPDELCKKIINTSPNLEIWKEKRKKTEYETILDRGFDFLFFNRTNYSGIYNANPIGGMEQKSQYTIDCRWNPSVLCEKILLCSNKLQDVEISNIDFQDVITRPGDNVLLIIDPPYYEQGNKLYPEKMSHNQHVQLANLLKKTNHKFLLTIDDCPTTQSLYMDKAFFINQESWLYSINSKRKDKDRAGKELFISNFDIRSKT
ncbi:TPA: DNA adenine methylase [Bacillus thuringiensis]|nr:DNA adenine methylase [Bacillus thuringiensis]HDR8186662.1 DNA adenine methylase [Bacillus thuringiensis]